MIITQTPLRISLLGGGTDFPSFFRRHGGAVLFYMLESRYLRALSAADLEPHAQGFSLYRRYERLDGTPLADSLPAGEVVRVRLVLRVPEARTWVALDDPLPAGMEPINLAFATTGSHTAMDGRRYGRRGLLDGRWYFYHAELRDDRVLHFADSLPTGTYELAYLTRATTVGTFTAPPARVSAMYHEGLWGRSDAPRVKVQ